MFVNVLRATMEFMFLKKS